MVLCEARGGRGAAHAVVCAVVCAVVIHGCRGGRGWTGAGTVP